MLRSGRLCVHRVTGEPLPLTAPAPLLCCAPGTPLSMEITMHCSPAFGQGFSLPVDIHF